MSTVETKPPAPAVAKKAVVAKKPATLASPPAPKAKVSLTEPIEEAGVAQLELDAVSAALTRVATPATPSAPAAKAEDESEEVTLKIGLPPTIEYQENVKDTINGSAFEIRLYSEGCTECGHLVASCEEKQTHCHFTANNPYCPAAFTRIVFVGHRERLVERLKKAKASQDVNRVLKHLTSLEDETIDVKLYVLQQVGMLPAPL